MYLCLPFVCGEKKKKTVPVGKGEGSGVGGTDGRVGFCVGVILGLMEGERVVGALGEKNV